MMFGQTFNTQDLLVIPTLVVLEGLLSLDNALVLGILAKRLPKHLQRRALTYGLVGALVFRLIAIATATYLMKWAVAKLLGGAYLVYVAVKHFVSEARRKADTKVVMGPDGEPMAVSRSTGLPLAGAEADADAAARTSLPATHARMFWSTVVVIELTDIAFAVDSILAAVGLVSNSHTGDAPPAWHPKLWVVFLGGMIGVVLMRFAAIVFIRMLERFPRFEVAAYLLVTVIGVKLVLDWAASQKYLPGWVDFHSTHSPAFWVFWGTMALCFALGFVPQKKKA